MNAPAEKKQKNKDGSSVNAVSQKKNKEESSVDFTDNRPEAAQLKTMQDLPANDPIAQMKEMSHGNACGCSSCGVAEIKNVVQTNAAPVQRTFNKDFKELKTLAALNTALGNLTPAVTPNIALTDYPGAVGATTPMLDKSIADDTNSLYDSITRADVVGFYTQSMTNAVAPVAPVTPTTYTLSTATGKGAVQAFIKGSEFNGSGRGCAEPQLLSQYTTGKKGKKLTDISLSWSQNTLPCDNCHNLLKTSSQASRNTYVVKIEDNLGKPYGSTHGLPNNADTTITYSGGTATYAKNS
jgi:hypothetical protein